MADYFITHNSQLKKLRKKNLVVPTRAKRILESEGYHAVINGYREPFKSTTSPEFMFIPGTHFDELYALYELDRDLRSVFLKKILKIEQALRSSIAYHFSINNKANNRAYLDFRNFDYTRTHKNIIRNGRIERKLIGNDVHNVIATLSKKMSNPHNDVIKHYITEHQSVPLWIVVNTLTLGELLYLYTFLMPDQRIAVAKDFGVSDDKLHWFIEQLKIYRNKCAHEERFYCYKQRWGMKNVYHLHQKMKLYLTKADANKLDSNVRKTFLKYSSSFKSIPFANILIEMGYPTNYLSI
ncbi:Abi family protein [Erysipelothrix rhusiopathiae]|nr:Abi family protein [Erysipelothrix rhusiopathiae]MDE8086106.1 Abi family protein [Erysipelothrix rhusiopathiae]MDE8089630.1 Abi family protein [Erysipelothrix rhusiopathiae]MDE8096209.1 Abi family protein [Erysipelothrix rhusiopathiae]MDE8101379.1 Abi family protein [Erysipelothrix rhusiopathiae]